MIIHLYAPVKLLVCVYNVDFKTRFTAFTRFIIVILRCGVRLCLTTRAVFLNLTCVGEDLPLAQT